MNAILGVDGYKIGHIDQFCKGTEGAYFTWTPRSNAYLPEVKKVVVFNVQGFLKDLVKFFDDTFFNVDKKLAVKRYERRIKSYLFKDTVNTKHIEALHDLGFLPIKVKSLQEGSKVDIRVPILTVESTIKEHFWIAGYLEDLISIGLWHPMTVASIANAYRELFEKWNMKTVGNIDFVPFQGHDFSFRGLVGKDCVNTTGAAWLTSFVGTDNIPSIDWVEENYNADSDNELIGCSVNASEHSVAESYMEKDEQGNYVEGFEKEYIRCLIQDVYPTGIVSIVADTIDLWTLITEHIVEYKDIIMSRDGKVVLRPDSGNPADILCGNPLNTSDTSQGKGVVELLWDIFGGTVNALGYKELDPHIGAIYGDSITLELAEEIFSRLEAKGFASNTVVLGIGSYSLLGKLSRDSLGFAYKETSITKNGKDLAVFKDPITDSGTKKSAKGRVAVVDGKLIEGLDSESEALIENNQLETIFYNGKLIKETSLAEIRERVRN